MSESPEETIRRFINEIVGQTEADIIIGSRSCAPGDGLNYGNMERLVREAPDVLDLLASLRQRQEELEDELDSANESIGISREHLSRAGFEAAFLDDVAALAANEVLSLRTQLQQAEQESIDEKARADRLGEHATELFGQLQQAETALRRVMELPLDDDTLWWNRDTPLAPKAITIARQYFAALAAPPADPPTSSQEKP